MAYRLEIDEGIAEGLRRSGAEQLDHAVSALAEGVESDPVEAVHDARKAVKKQRAVLRLGRPAIPGSERKRHNETLRKAARKLSAVRDADVVIETLDELSERFAGQLPEATFVTIRHELVELGAAAREALASSPARAEALDALRVARDRIGDLELRQDGWDAIDDGLARTYKRGRAAWRRARAQPSDRHLHDWRKRAKDLWYHLRLLAPVTGQTVRGQAKEAHELSDVLGDDHDLAVLRRTLELAGADPPVELEAVLHLIDHRRGQLQTQAMAVGERLYGERPTAFRRRLRDYWKASRSEARAEREHAPAELARATRAT
jgi:CHAD domain-containing protein